MKIKLRDLTLEQFKEWKEKVNLSTPWKCNGWNCNGCIFKNVNCYSQSTDCWVNHKDMFSDKFLDQEIELLKEKEL